MPVPRLYHGFVVCADTPLNQRGIQVSAHYQTDVSKRPLTEPASQCDSESEHEARDWRTHRSESESESEREGGGEPRSDSELPGEREEDRGRAVVRLRLRLTDRRTRVSESRRSEHRSESEPVGEGGVWKRAPNWSEELRTEQKWQVTGWPVRLRG